METLVPTQSEKTMAVLRKHSLRPASQKFDSSLFAAGSFRDCLEFLANSSSSKVTIAVFSGAKLAKHCGVSTGFISKINTGQALPNSDLLESICEFFKLSEVETEFVQLCCEKEKCSSQKRKARIELQIQRIRDQHQTVSRKLGAPKGSTPATLVKDPQEKNPKETAERLQVYYGNPYLSALHIGLTLKNYQTRPEVLGAKLGIQEAFLWKGIIDLEKMGLVIRENDRWKSVDCTLHLPKTSPLFRTWTSLMRHSTADWVLRTPEQNPLLFSVTFSTSVEVKEKLRDELLNLIQRMESLVSNSKEEELCQINLDLFSLA